MSNETPNDTWVGILPGGLVAVRTDSVVFVNDGFFAAAEREARIAALQKTLIDDRIATFLDLHINRAFYDNTHSDVNAAAERSADVSIDGQTISAVRVETPGYTAM